MRLIDADALTERMREVRENCEIARPYILCKECRLCWAPRITETLEDAPTIEAELVRHGRWIDGTSQGSYSIYCSYCGSHKETICPSNYCPNCGCRMQGDDNG